jgi:GH24 family phage-related lysozyme (muramidase)
MRRKQARGTDWLQPRSPSTIKAGFGLRCLTDVTPFNPSMSLHDTFGLQKLTAELTLDEGKAAFPYLDTKGLMTIGIGRNLSTNGLTKAEIDYLFGNDVENCCMVMDQQIPWWRDLPSAKQRVMVNLVFNLGWYAFAKFRRFLAAMKAGDYPQAARELENSDWYKQVGDRGPRMVERLLTPPGVVA